MPIPSFPSAVILAASVPFGLNTICPALLFGVCIPTALNPLVLLPNRIPAIPDIGTPPVTASVTIGFPLPFVLPRVTAPTFPAVVPGSSLSLTLSFPLPLTCNLSEGCPVFVPMPTCQLSLRICIEVPA